MERHSRPCYDSSPVPSPCVKLLFSPSSYSTTTSVEKVKHPIAKTNQDYQGNSLYDSLPFSLSLVRDCCFVFPLSERTCCFCGRAKILWWVGLFPIFPPSTSHPPSRETTLQEPMQKKMKRMRCNNDLFPQSTIDSITFLPLNSFKNVCGWFRLKALHESIFVS